MSRTFNSVVMSELNAQETGETYIMLLTLESPEIPDNGGVIWLSKSSFDVVSQGITYKGMVFDVHLPSQRRAQPPTVNLSILNVNRLLVQGVRLLVKKPFVTLSVIRLSDPDTVLVTTRRMQLTEISWDDTWVTGRLSYAHRLDIGFPSMVITPQTAPAGF